MKVRTVAKRIVIPDLRIHFAFTQTGEISCQKTVDLFALVGGYGARSCFLLLWQSL